MDKTFALYATALYILTTSPATASSPYTEPLFAFLTCTGLWLILPSRISKTSGAELVISKVLGLLCLAGATATRSLGILSVIAVIWQGFLQPIYQGDHRVSVRPLLRTATSLTTHQLVLKRGILTAVAATAIILPFIAFQYTAYVTYCSDAKTRPWCGHALPSVYSYVQDHYW
jgi:phosphatidylinositol glycan class V